jgi:cellulose synthase operon protein C
MTVCKTAFRLLMTAAANAVFLCAQGDPAQLAAQAKQLLESGRYAEAAAAYENVAKFAPGNPGIQLNIGMAWHAAGKLDKAIPPLQRAQASIPNAALILGDIYLRTGRPGEAVAPLRRFLRQLPEHRDAHRMMADAATAGGQHAEAAASLQKLISWEPNDAALRYGLGRTWEAMAIASFTQLSRRFPESAEWFALSADSRDRNNQRRTAYFLYRKALQKNPQMRGAHARIAEIYRQQNETAWAEQEMAAEAKLPSPDCRIASTQCYCLAGQYSAALRLPTLTAHALYWRIQSLNALAASEFMALEKLGESAERSRFLAEQSMTRRDFTAAEKYWREALTMRGEDTRLRLELARALLAAKGFDEAAKEAALVVAANPEAADALALQGEILLAQQNASEAVPLLRKAITLQPTPEHRSLLGRALLANGDATGAVPHLAAALPLDVDGSLHFQYLRACERAGNAATTARARALYQSAQQKLAQQNQLIEDELKISAPPR